jgi:hypothetical protein
MRVARPLKDVVAQLLNPADASAKHWTFAVLQKEVVRKGSQPQTFPQNRRNQHNQYSTNSRSSVSGVSILYSSGQPQMFPRKSDPKISFLVIQQCFDSMLFFFLFLGSLFLHWCQMRSGVS